MGIGTHVPSVKEVLLGNEGSRLNGGEISARGQHLEDRALKAAAQFMGKELLPLLGIEGVMKRIAPTEQVHLDLKGLVEDFNYEMEDGTWKHLEFESDRITKEDLRRFHAYEAMISYQYKVDVTTCVVCSARVKKVKSVLRQGLSTYRVQVVRLKDYNADEIIGELEEKQKKKRLEREELLKLLLTPLMDGNMPQPKRIERSMRLLKNEGNQMKQDELLRMEAVLYTLAMKFLTADELSKVKEEIKMTILGEMIRQDGIEIGLAKGIKEMILDNLEEGIGESRICEKLCRRFELSPEKAKEYFDMYGKGDVE